MKFTLVVVALIGTTSAYLGEKTWSLRTLNAHRSEAEDFAGYNKYSLEAVKEKSGHPYRTNGDEPFGAE